MFEGNLVRLIPADEAHAALQAKWESNPGMFALFDTDPVVPVLPARRKQKWESESPDRADFMIERSADNTPIGVIGLFILPGQNGDAFVYIGIGESNLWGQGYGTDAMRVLLGYAFDVLELYRVSLGVFDTNLRAIRSYEKSGFIREGHRREDAIRAGKRYGSVMMGILRSEWKAAG